MSTPPTTPNLLKYAGVTRPRPVGAYSGTTRDFAKELQTPEPSSDVPIEQYLASDKKSMYCDAEFRTHAEKVWTDLLKAASEDFTQRTPVWFVAQSHIDVAWKWRFGQSIRKAQATFGNAVTHMQYYPDFTFAASQSCLFEMVEKYDPALFAEVKRRVEGGQFELVGGCWVEADPRMPSGEAFARQHLYGQRYFLRHFDRIATVAWYQDSFGYSIQIPQFSARSGMKYFFTNKICSNKDTVFPFSHFHWDSPDGSRILAYQSHGSFGVLSTWARFKHTRRMLQKGTDVEKSATFTYVTDQPEILPIWDTTLLPVVGSFYGKGDGGHGPTGEEYALVRWWMESGKRVRHVPATTLFQEIERYASRLPVWKDELYYEFHRATLTTHHLMKLMNRWSEWATLAAENLATLACVLAGGWYRYPYERLTRLWKNLCMMQMHDVLPGSSVPEVYDDCYDLWEQAREWLPHLNAGALQAIRKYYKLEDGHGSLLFINPLPFVWSGIAEIPANSTTLRMGWFVGQDNAACVIQKVPADPEVMEPLERRVERCIAHVSVPALGAATYCEATFSKVKSPEIAIEETADRITLENFHYHLEIEKETGSLRSLKLIDRGPKGQTREPLETLAGPSNELQLFEDFQLGEPAWNFHPAYHTMPRTDAQITRTPAHIVERGPVRWTVEWDFSVTTEEAGHATFTQRLSMYDTAEGIDLETITDWHMQWTTAKNYFVIAGDPQESIAEVAYGTIHRKLYPSANHDVPRWENHMQTFLSVPARDHSFCFHVLNQGKYGFDNIKGNKIGISMIRSPMYPEVPKSSWVADERKEREKAGYGVPPEFVDEGMHRINLRLLPRRGAWQDHHIEREAHMFNCLPQVQFVQRAEFTTGDLISTTEGIQAASIKLAEAPNEVLEDWMHPTDQPNARTLVLRGYETLGSSHNGTITLAPLFGVKHVEAADLLERPVADPVQVTTAPGGAVVASFSASWAPHEVKTFLLHR